MINTFNELKEHAIKISGPIVVNCPQHNRPEILNLSFDNIKDHTYAINSNTLAFAYGGALYVIPLFPRIINILLENGFIYKSMYVPFSTSSYPVFHEAKWKRLKHYAHAHAHARSCII